MKIHIGTKAYDVYYTENPWDVMKKLNDEPAKIMTYDTETTGLHIKKDKPFLAAVCFNTVVYVMPALPSVFHMLIEASKKVQRVYAHNTTYDMHMMANIVGDDAPLEIKNWGDTQGLARLSFESISARDGGHKLGLKYIGRKFIDPEAGIYEDAVKSWIDQEKKARLKILKVQMRGQFNILAKQVEDIIKNRDKGARFHSPEAEELYAAWHEDYPPVTYQDVPMEIMLPYVAVDVILTQQLVYKSLPVVVKKEQQVVMNREFRLITTIYRMERRGIQTNREYLQQSADRMMKYIDQLYTELRELTGIENLSVNQHERVKVMYEEWLGQTLKSSDKQFLNRMSREYKDSKEGRCGWLISALRRCEKWLSTYIVKILKDSEYDGRFYTQLNQFNPVSGRFSGDAQQFPKDAIQAKLYEDDKEAEEIYHPRKAFLGTMYYLD